MQINRRQFLKTTSLTTGSLLGATQHFLKENPYQPMSSNKLGLKIYSTNWGWQGTLTEFCKASKDEGYDGVEIWVPRGQAQRDEFFEAIAKYDLSYGFLAGNSGATFEDNLDAFHQQLDTACSFKPDFVNCHSGKDWLTTNQMKKFFEYSLKKAEEVDFPIYHETHRGRILFHPQITKKVLESFPKLRLTLDISHWCVVSESLLADQTEAIELALSRTDHVHSRIGFEEGPQVSDPRAPEFERAVKAHFEWWDKIVDMKTAANSPLTMTTEFGPANYMWTLPYTKQPVADQWAVNVHMMHLWRERYLS